MPEGWPGMAISELPIRSDSARLSISQCINSLELDRSGMQGFLWNCLIRFLQKYDHVIEDDHVRIELDSASHFLIYISGIGTWRLIERAANFGCTQPLQAGEPQSAKSL